MTEKNVLKLYNHLKFLAAGNFTAQDFNKEYGEGEDGGFMHMGKLTSDRRKLIMADAKRAIKRLEEKKITTGPNKGELAYPYLMEKKEKKKSKEK